MAESEIVVNEAQPDILKIIQIDTKAFVREVRVSAGKAVVSGSVDLSLLYICEREGESLKGLNEMVDFEHTVENTKIYDNMTANVNAEVVRIDFDLLNSRKIRVKLIISLDTAVNSDKVFEICLLYTSGKNLIFKAGGVDACRCSELMGLIQEQKLRTDFLITHRAPLENILEGYSVFEQKSDHCIKWVVTPPCH